MLETSEDDYQKAGDIDELNETREPGLYTLNGWNRIGGTTADKWFVDLRNGTFDFYGYREGDVVEPPTEPKPVKKLRSMIMAEGTAKLNKFV